MTLSSPARRVAHAMLALTIGTTTISCDSNEPNGVSPDGSLNEAHFMEVEPADATIALGSAGETLTVRVLDGSGKPLPGGVRWSSSTPQIATVDAGGRVTPISSGETMVIASRGAIADTAIVSVVDVSGFAPARVLVEPRVATVGPGKTLQLNAVVIDARGRKIPGVPVQWSSVDPEVASLAANGLVQGGEAGRGRIIVSVGALRDTAWVRVGSNVPPGRVQVQPRVDTLASATEDLTLFAQVRDTTGAPVPGATVRWSSLNPALASVSSDGTVTASGSGMARIVANYGPTADTADVFIAAWQFPSSVAIQPKTDTIAQVGGTIDLEAIITDPTGALLSEDYARWTSIDPQILSVHWRTGVVTALAKGVARIFVRAGNARDTAVIWVAPAPVAAVPTRLTITPASYTLTVLGETVDLLGQVLDAGGNPMAASLSWLSTDPAVASVDQGGHVTALGNGTARIIAHSDELADTATITVAIEDEDAGIQYGGVVISPAQDTVSVGGTISLMAEVRDAQGNRLSDEYVHWESLDASASIEATETAVLTGMTVTGRVSGIARIVATHNSDADTAVIHVVGGGSGSVQSVRISLDADTIPTVGGTVQLSAVIVDASGNIIGTQGITWASLNTGIATVSSSGLVRGVSQGVALVTATFQSAADTIVVWVEPGVGTGGGGAPQTGTTVQSVIMGYSGTGAVLVSSGIPLPQGLMFPGDTRKLAVYVNGKEQSLYVEALAGRHPDGSVRSVLVQMRYVVGAGQTVPAQIVIGPTVSRTTQDLPPTNPVYGYGNPLPQAALLPTSPAYLIGTGIVGETLPAPASFSTKWESNFKTIGDGKWNIVQSIWGTPLLDGNTIVSYNYYDRALMYFAEWARTGDPEYWRRAVLYELAFRDIYFRLYNYKVQPHNIQIEGLELQYLLTGDRESLNGVARAADYYYQIWLPQIGDTNANSVEGRIQARTLDGLMTAARLGVTAHDYVAASRTALTRILGSQRSDGSYRFRSICDTQYNYMTGLLNDAMIKYYTYLDRDSRIVSAMKRSLDFMWSSQWIASAGAFQYATGNCPGLAGTAPAADLNLLIVNGFGWYAKVTGDASYRQTGDIIFMKGVANAWLGNTYAQADKQFNQQYRSAYRYLFYRQ